MADGTAAGARAAADEFETFADLAGALAPAQRQALARVLTAAQLLDARGDQAGLDQLLEDVPTLLRGRD